MTTIRRRRENDEKVSLARIAALLSYLVLCCFYYSNKYTHELSVFSNFGF